MSSRLASLLVPATFLLPAAACAVESGQALEFRETWGCDTCGTNSPRANDFEVPELHLFGEPNGQNVRLIGLRAPNGTLYTADAEDDEFIARDSGGNKVAAGGDLVDWDIVLADELGTLDLHIRAHDAEIDSWAEGGNPISAYALAYDTETAPVETRNVCPSVSDDPDHTAVTLIVGERYDPEHKLVLAEQVGWVTLACEDEATFKMKRMNYGPNDDFDGLDQPATPAQRQATLKMITADYCGTGHSYTAQGTPIYWKNASSTVSPVSLPVSAPLEAEWTEDGALCLGTPRYADRADVLLECELPLCTTPAVAAEWRTWVP